MTQKKIDAFLDTSVIIAAVMSPTGGARMLFHLGDAQAIRLFVGKTVLTEADEVLRRKALKLLPFLAELLHLGRVTVGAKPTKSNLEKVTALVSYRPDALVLAEALQAAPDWFVTHDREHFLKNPILQGLSFQIGTPGDLLAHVREAR
jgi:predicted nucleic acid-binding protein